LRYITANYPPSRHEPSTHPTVSQPASRPAQGFRDRRESVVREAFKDLLKGWARSRDLVFVPEYEIATPAKERRYVDGALVHTLRVPFESTCSFA
jgi:hypothetical protein